MLLTKNAEFILVKRLEMQTLNVMINDKEHLSTVLGLKPLFHLKLGSY